MKNSLESLNKIAKTQRSICRKQSEINALSRQRDDLNDEKWAETNIVITDLLNEFREQMQDRRYFEDYVRGAYTSDFTKHVSRTETRERVSQKHFDAVQVFNDALKSLNHVFAREIIENEEFANFVVRASRLKNLDKI